jgi:hypothetical protein
MKGVKDKKQWGENAFNFMFLKFSNFLPFASSSLVSRLLLSPVFFLQPHQKIAKHLVLAFAVLRLRGIAEKGTQLVLAQSKAPQAKDLQHPFFLEVQGNLEFP